MKKLLLWFTLITGVVFANDELKFNITLHTNTQEANFYMLKRPRFISENISCPQTGSWIEEYEGFYFGQKWIKGGKIQCVFTANVPLISTYLPDSFDLLWPALSLHTRVDDTSLYFVVQKKTNSELKNKQDNNVTVKYHPLISDGINTGAGKPNNKVLKGKFKLRDSKGNSLGDYRDMMVSTNKDVSFKTALRWPDPENDDVLKEMITSRTSEGNSIVISELLIGEDIQKEVFIDQINLGVKKIVTVHVLLNEKDFDRFIQDISQIEAYNDDLLRDFEIIGTQAITNDNKDNSFLENYVVNKNAIPAIRDGLELYRKEIIKFKDKMAINNFELKLSASQSELAAQALKNFYIFDLPGIEEGAQEKKVEEALYLNIGKFLDELGPGFAFMGRQCQYHLEIGKQDFYIDLLFYHCKLHCFVVIELKDKEFEPEDVGKMNFCLSALDDFKKQPDDNPSIGLILCKTKDNAVAEYALKGVTKPIGVSEYKLRK